MINFLTTHWPSVLSLLVLLLGSFWAGRFVGNRRSRKLKVTWNIRHKVSIDDAPSTLLKMMMSEINLSPGKWDKLLSDYLHKECGPVASRERSALRGNLTKEFDRDAITWKVFTKFLQILKPKTFSLRLRVVWPDDSVSSYEVGEGENP